MEFLTYTGEIDIDMHDIVMSLDDIFHREITDRTGATVSHDAILIFVLTIINENNKKILEFRRQEKEVKDLIEKNEDLIEKNEKEFERKVKNGKTVDNLGGILNKFKYYYLNYILVQSPIGCGSPGFLTMCETCLYTYNDTKCKVIRKDNKYKLVFEDNI